MATQITVSGTFESSPSVAASGSITWKLSSPMFDSAGHYLVPAAPITITLDGSGHFSELIWANDDATTEPQGTTYTVSGTINGVAWGPYVFVLSHTMAPTVDLSEMTPTNASSIAWLAQSSGDISGLLPGPITVTAVQGRAVSATAPTNGQGLVWNSTAGAWQPGGSSGNATEIQGVTVASTAPTLHGQQYVYIPSATSWELAQGRYVDVTAEGIDNTGSASDNNSSGQFNTLLAALAAEGYIAYLPQQKNGSQGIYKFATSIQMGNGTSTADSTVPMGDIVGAGWPGFYYWPGGQISPYTYGAVVLEWTGSSGTSLISINGPLQGGSLRNLYLYGASLCSNGISLSGAQYCDFENLVIDSFTNIAVQNNPAGNTNNTSSQNDSFRNRWRRILINLIQNTNGFYLGSGVGGGGHGNTCYEDVRDMIVAFPSSTSSYNNGILFGACDTCFLENIICYPIATHQVGILFVTNNGFVPQANVVRHAEIVGSAGTSVSQSGSNAMLWSKPNVITPTTDNGTAVNPQIAGVKWEASTPLGAFSAPGIPASGTALTNNTGVPCRVFVNGGTVSAISINGTATGQTTGLVIIMPGDTITLTYSSAPTWTWFGM